MNDKKLQDTLETRGIEGTKESESKAIIMSVYNSLIEKGYNPVNQLVGYILSGDPTYITSHNNARTLIRRLERDELLEVVIKHFLKDCDITV